MTKEKEVNSRVEIEYYDEEHQYNPPDFGESEPHIKIVFDASGFLFEVYIDGVRNTDIVGFETDGMIFGESGAGKKHWGVGNLNFRIDYGASERVMRFRKSFKERCEQKDS